MRYQLKVTVLHALGQFEGYALTEGDASLDHILALRAQLQMNPLKYLVLSTLPFDIDGKEIAFPEKILEQAVLTFETLEFPHV